MAKVLIIYHSQSGNTEAMAKVVAESAKSAGATVSLKRATEANAKDIMDCDIVAIGTPNYFGYMSGLVKDFFDRVWFTIREKVSGKPYATFGSKGGGGSQALDSVERILNNIRMVKAFESVVATRQPTEEVLAQCRELGKKLAHPEKKDKIEEPKL